MNIAVIFAGGKGQRMGIADTPKQFLEINGKAIIIHTLEKFDKHPEIDAIVVSCIPGWKRRLEELIEQSRLKKVKKIVSGGKTGQISIFNGLKAANDIVNEKDTAIVLIHDGVRPLINEKLISDNIESVKKFNSAITAVSAKETLVVSTDETDADNVLDRSTVKIAKAPQSFWLKDIYKAHLQAVEDEIDDFTDSCTLMKYYGYSLHLVEGPKENIKITTPEDYFLAQILMKNKE